MDEPYFWPMAKARKNAGMEDEEISFEQALSQLEKIVTEMEGEDLELENLLDHYREGTRLSKLCQDKLSQAELLIKRLDDEAAKGTLEDE